MAEKLKIIPLGGLNEIGKTMTVIEYGKDMFVVDCGIAFPDTEMPGIDLVIPDASYIIQNKNKLRGLVITHGHEDHIGAIPYLIEEMGCPIYCTKLTGGIIGTKLEEHNLTKKVHIETVCAGQKIKLGVFEIEFIHVNHSIADAVSLAVFTPLGTVIVTGDFKIDTTPVDGKMIDLARFGALGNEGVLLLLSDSTNVERPGYTISERKVGESLDAIFKGCDSRIIVASFASNVHRVQQIINVAHSHKRKVAVSGRSMENIMRVAMELGYMTVPENTLVDINKITGYPKDKVCIITTGSQGEPMSALYRMAFSAHKQINIGPGDKVILSASPIPGNEKTVYKVINELFRKGAEVVYEKLAEVHSSGHACAEELKLMIALTKPRYFMPLHGEYRHLRANANLAKLVGVKPENVFIGEVGRILELSRTSAKLGGMVQSGKLLVDGLGVGEVGAVVLRDRKHLAQDGIIVVVVTLDEDSGEMLAGPHIVSRGFVYVNEAQDLMEELRKVAASKVQECYDNNVTDWATMRTEIKDALSDLLYKKSKRSPMIIPVIMEA